MELQRKETKEMLEDLTTRDQRMMFGLLTMVHMAETKEQLDQIQRHFFLWQENTSASSPL